MYSYLQILTELKEMIENDSIPKRAKTRMLKLIDALMKELWPYSD